MNAGDPAATMRCPTCRAEQEWSDTCRRCQSDLRLLADVCRAAERLRRQVLRDLRDGRAEAALDGARRLQTLNRSASARRLLAVSRLLAGDFAAAVASVATELGFDRG